MNKKIKKIDYIKNMAVFKDFRWDLSVRDRNNNIAEFKKINIFYGRNYSGKTTLSQIFRAFETGSVSDKYSSPEFQLSLDDNSIITQDSLNDHGQVIRVFNKDFVKENLRFIIDDEQTIKSFAILGEDNTRIRKEIENHKVELGSEEEKTGLLGDLLDAKERLSKAEKAHSDKSEKLDNKLREKANNTETGIKYNRIFGNPNYVIDKIKKDIAVVTENSYTPLSDEQERETRDLLKEDPKEEIKESAIFNLKYSKIVSKAKQLIEKKIYISDPIQKLLNDAALEEWVRTGQKHHKGKRDRCAFCGNDLPADLWEKLDKHFNKEYEELRSAIDNLLEDINSEKTRVPDLLIINNSDFYSNFTQNLYMLKYRFSTCSSDYCNALESIKEQLKKRINSIFTPLSFNKPSFVEGTLSKIRDSYEELRNESNQLTSSLSDKQSNARKVLRLHEVSKFITYIKYHDEYNAIQTLKDKMEESKKDKDIVENNVRTKQAKIGELEAQLKDESKGADRVNSYLNNFFAHQFLSLKAVEETSENVSGGGLYEITRNDKKAFNLSEGECSLIAFCYFMAKLEDAETKDHQPIIWIDDPVSSLDANHIFFVYSLISTGIVAPEKYKDSGTTQKQNQGDHFKQLFISTHNLEFLKYLKRLPRTEDNGNQYFIINRSGQYSDISLMPQYLKDYATEFNFLFHQIYKCAQCKCNENIDCCYSFGNNARKFLETFLYYKYPTAEKDYRKRFEWFFKDDRLEASLMNRGINELSHSGVFELGTLPMDIQEIKTIAKFILKKIRENDSDQYRDLLQSIGVKEDPLKEET